ncbi:hypothetical protein L596_014232 [Steinernema carpocapsae]|uniref:Uncharacterized protein n=1 Tax=Steinernema carpocapsae TaxID=34508 RepID=A0A4U5NC96_STECR|nr:hypothetical protein L596_014232 [Steinernema carpocapsae]
MGLRIRRGQRQIISPNFGPASGRPWRESRSYPGPPRRQRTRILGSAHLSRMINGLRDAFGGDHDNNVNKSCGHSSLVMTAIRPVRLSIRTKKTDLD